jgi:DNA-binding NtrC family response regulator
MFKRHCTKKYQDYEGSFIDILKSIEEYDWPGNVRELNNFVERTSALINFHSIDEVKSIVKEKYNNSSYLVSTKFNVNGNLSDDSINLDNWEYETIINALKKNKLVVTKTALDLGMSRSTLIRKIKKYNIKI